MLRRKDINILVTGAKGQLGSYLVGYFNKKSFAKGSRIGKVLGIDVEDLDIRDASTVADFFNKSSIDYVVHCAAATDTAAIEKDPESYYAANCLGPKNIAESCARNRIKMVFISTDYVLSERSTLAGDIVQEFPVNQYGLQKLIAEQFVKDAYKGKARDLVIFRSSWMFGNSSRSFVEKFLKNVFKKYVQETKSNSSSKVQIPVVDDAYGRPTSVWYIARTIESLVLDQESGIVTAHFPLRQISRHEWACMIWESFLDSCARAAKKEDFDLVEKMKSTIEIVPCKSSSFQAGMHHPGKIVGNESLMDGVEVYRADTQEYIDRNCSKYIEMARECEEEA